MERQLLKASQENQRLDIQRQSLQRLLHRLVQGGAVVDDTMDPQQMEAHDDTRVAALEREDPMENIWIESMRSPSESNRDLISTKLSPRFRPQILPCPTLQSQRQLKNRAMQRPPLQLEIVKPFNPGIHAVGSISHFIVGLECHHTHEHVDESQWVDNNQLSDTKGGLAVDQPNDELLPEPFASIVTIDIVMQQVQSF
ncbi:unnamed protein product [Aphanomyces euteiches]